MANKRIDAIDYLRAIAILGMIATHVLSYNLGPARINGIWNYLHFVVPLFVFCSGYVLYKQYAGMTWSITTLTTWYKKRFIRLAIPYYGFTVLHYAVWFIAPFMFSGLGLSGSPSFIIASLFMVGVDYGWLPLLFLQLMVVTPILLVVKKKPLAYLLLAAAIILITILLLFTGPLSVDYRWYMWIPWSLILIVSFWVAELEDIPGISLTKSALVSSVLFAYSFRFLNSAHLPLTLTLHKYPPDVFYLSYGIAVGSLLLLFYKLRFIRIQPLLTWISSRSYTLFFVHYIVIDMAQTYQRIHGSIPILIQLLISMGGSCLIVWLYGLVRSKVYSGK